MRKVKLTVFGLMFCLLLHLTGCAAAQKPLRVTLVLKTVTEVAEFWGTLLSGVEKGSGGIRRRVGGSNLAERN